MQDESDKEEKLGDQEKRNNCVARNGFQQLSVLWSWEVAHPSNCVPFPIFICTFLGKIRSHLLPSQKTLDRIGSDRILDYLLGCINGVVAIWSTAVILCG